MPRLKANGIDLYYETQGRGEPLLLIAGLGATCKLWDSQVPLLAHEFRVITFDNRGAGRSDKPQAPYSIALFADDTAGLMDALSIDSAFVYGESMGGLIAQEFAVRYPRRARALVLGCTTFGGPNSVLPSPDAASTLSSIGSMGTGAGLEQVMRVFLSPQFQERNRDEALRRIRSYLDLRPPADAYGRQLAACLAFDLYDRLAQIQAPTLVINGEDDALIPSENSRIMAERIPGAELILFPKTGHLYFDELPEKSAETVIDFLRRRGSRA
jgi:pimeloyl-ACP methyl ester carboxylesterase